MKLRPNGAICLIVTVIVEQLLGLIWFESAIGPLRQKPEIAKTIQLLLLLICFALLVARSARRLSNPNLLRSAIALVGANMFFNATLLVPTVMFLLLNYEVWYRGTTSSFVSEELKLEQGSTQTMEKGHS